MLSIADKLIKMDKDINTAEKELSKITGKKEVILKNMKRDYGCDTVDELEDLREKNVKEVEKLEAQIKRGMEKLENAYDWNF